MQRPMLCLAGLLVTVALASPFRLPAATTNLFGFAGPEIYPIDPQISLLHAADLDGDGHNDLIVANNLHSKISLLYNRAGHTNQTSDADVKLELNELPPDARFRIDSLPSDERISGLDVVDLNGDHRPDLVYFGDGKDLEVRYNLGTNGWSEPKRWHLDDGQLNPNALAVGDLNGDGRPDVVLLGDNGTYYYFEQQADGTLADPKKVSYFGNPKAVQICDVDGDGRNDLVLVDFESPAPFHIRFQNANGELGPEIHFRTPTVRSFTFDTLAGDRTNYLVSIVQATGRAEVSQIVRRPAEPLAGPLRQGQLQVLPLNHSDASPRGILWADVNGDNRPDLVVAEPESGQLSVYLQQADGSLGAPRKFPSLAGVAQIAAADWDGNGRPTLFLLSRDENSVSTTRFDSVGRLPFPTPLELDGKPLVMAVGALKPGARPSLAVIVEKEGARFLVIRSASGHTTRQKLSDSFKSNPATMAIHDVDQDGRPDLVLLMPYEKIKVLLQQRSGKFEEHDVNPPGGTLEQPWFVSADVDNDGKPELLLPQKNFLRAVVLESTPAPDGSTNGPDWIFRVKDQINGAASDSHLVAATVLPNPKGGTPSLFLLDAEHQQLSLCQRDTAGVWQVVKNLALPVSDFAALAPVSFGVPAIAFTSPNTVAWLPLAGDVWSLTKLDDYDTPIRDGFLNDMVAGDLNGSGRKQIVFLETARNYLDLVQFTPQRKLARGDRWQVFEQHTFRNNQNGFPEPREALVADVTGDGKNDLIVIVHDRILVYPQQ